MIICKKYLLYFAVIDLPMYDDRRGIIRTNQEWRSRYGLEIFDKKYLKLIYLKNLVLSTGHDYELIYHGREKIYFFKLKNS